MKEYTQLIDFFLALPLALFRLILGVIALCLVTLITLVLCLVLRDETKADNIGNWLQQRCETFLTGEVEKERTKPWIG